MQEDLKAVLAAVHPAEEEVRLGLVVGQEAEEVPCLEVAARVEREAS